MKVLAHIITIGGIILYFIAKHESNRPASASRKADAVEVKPSPEELERQKQLLLKSLADARRDISNLKNLAILYAKSDHADKIEAERRQREQSLEELKQALCEVIEKQREYKTSTAEAKVCSELISHRNADELSESHRSNASDDLADAEQSKQMKTKKSIPWRIICICGSFILVVGIFAYLGLTFPTAKSKYEQGLALLEAGQYSSASTRFLVSSIYDEEDGKDYALELCSYASARAEYEDDPCEETAVKVWRDFEKDYNKIIRMNSIPHYNEIVEFGKEIKAIAVKKDMETTSRIRKKLPYAHMPPEYIQKTKLGEADSVKVYGESKVYIWKSADGCTIFKATIDSNGYVSEAEKYNENTHWNGDTLLSTHEEYDRKPSYSYNSDPYDAGAYSSAEDFYYDYYDDFFDYEDAEYYWNLHN